MDWSTNQKDREGLFNLLKQFQATISVDKSIDDYVFYGKVGTEATLSSNKMAAVIVFNDYDIKAFVMMAEGYWVPMEDHTRTASINATDYLNMLRRVLQVMANRELALNRVLGVRDGRVEKLKMMVLEAQADLEGRRERLVCARKERDNVRELLNNA